MQNNTIHEGLFINGKMNGYGRTFFPNGTIYIGYYKNGLKQGTGIMIEQ